MADVVAVGEVIGRKIRLEMPHPGAQVIAGEQRFIAVDELGARSRRLCQLIAGVGRQDVVVVRQGQIAAGSEL